MPYYENLFENANKVNIQQIWMDLEGIGLNDQGLCSSPYRGDSKPSLHVGGEKNIIVDYGSDLPDGNKYWNPASFVAYKKGMNPQDAAIWILESYNPKDLIPSTEGTPKNGSSRKSSKMDRGTAKTLCSNPNNFPEFPDLIDWMRRDYGITQGTLAKCSAINVVDVYERSAILYHDFHQEGTFAKSKSVERVEGKRKPCLHYGAGYPIWFPFDPKPNQPLVITEGEEKALLAYQEFSELGYSVASLTGGAQSTLKPNDIERITKLKPEKIIFLYDDDEAGRKGVQKHCSQLRESLSVPFITPSTI